MPTRFVQIMFLHEGSTKLLQDPLSRYKSQWTHFENVFQKKNACEIQSGGKKAPIQYVPEQDLVEEALDMKPQSLKCTLANGSET